jgi:hypothetical protein
VVIATAHFFAVSLVLQIAASQSVLFAVKISTLADIIGAE